MGHPGASNHGSPTDVTYMAAALYKAVADSDISVLKNLNSSAADLHLQLTPKSNTVLHIAAQFGQPKCIKWILELNSCSSLLRRTNQKGDIPLHLAARGGHLKAVEALIHAAKTLPRETEDGIEADKAMMRMTNRDQDTALHEAVRHGHGKVVKLLIEEYPRLTCDANNSGETPLYIAAMSGFQGLVEIIIDNTISVSPAHTGFKGSTALHAAVMGNHREIVKKILQWKPDLTKEVDGEGWSPLHWAAYLGHTTIVKQLLEKCEKSVVYLGVKNHDNKTALHIAASCGHLGIVKLLVSHSPDCCEQVDDKGNNAFHLIKPEGKLPPYFRLPNIRWMNAGGLLSEKNDGGQTPVDLLIKLFPIDDSGEVLLSAMVFWFVQLAIIYLQQKVPIRKMWKSARIRGMITKKENCSTESEGIISSSENKEREKTKEISEIKIARESLDSAKTTKKENCSTESRGIISGNESKESKEISEIKKAGETHLIVATLIATVTFAAGFALPGGYVQNEGQNEGMSVLAVTGGYNYTNNKMYKNGRIPILEKGAFKAFVYTDATALVLSMSAVSTYFIMAVCKDKQVVWKLFRYAHFFTLLGIWATVIAFMSGLLSVLSPSKNLEDIIAFFTLSFPLVLLLPLIDFPLFLLDEIKILDPMKGKIMWPYLVGVLLMLLVTVLFLPSHHCLLCISMWNTMIQ